MVLWNKSHKAASLYFAYSIGWSVLGLILMWHGFAVADPLSPVQTDKSQFTLGIFEIAFGLIVMTLGNLVSFFKAHNDIMEDELERQEAERAAPKISREGR